MGAWKMILVSKGAIFHFHGYGRKGNLSFSLKTFTKLHIFSGHDFTYVVPTKKRHPKKTPRPPCWRNGVPTDTWRVNAQDINVAT